MDDANIVAAIESLERTLERLEDAQERRHIKVLEVLSSIAYDLAQSNDDRPRREQERHTELVKVLGDIAYDVAPGRNDRAQGELEQISHLLSMLVGHFMPSPDDDDTFGLSSS